MFIKELISRTENCGSKIAIVDKDGKRKTTYDELWKMAFSVAGKLRDDGFKKGDIIMISMPRSTEYVAAYLGILINGCVALPTAMDYSEHKIASIVNTCDVKSVMTLTDVTSIQNIDSQTAAALRSDRSDCVCSGTDPAFIIFTSGSIDVPKGILHDQNSLQSSVDRASIWQNDLEDVRLLSTAPFPFIVFTGEILGILWRGSTVYILPEEDRFDAKKIIGAINRFNINLAFISPQMLKVIFENSISIPSMKRIITGSEKVSDLYNPDIEIWNTYGMSETAGLTIFKIDKPYENTPIGDPMGDAEVFLNNGEICAIGYFSHEYIGLTDEAKNRFQLLEDGRTLIRTGDLAYNDDAGHIIFMNRRDWMVKINGQRVEPGEVSSTMKHHPLIKDAVVKGEKTNDNRYILIGYYISDGIIPSDDIKEFLSKTLPSYMIPTYYRRMVEFPKNRNGKLDMKRFPGLVTLKTRDIEPPVPPISDDEKKLQHIFHEILDYPEDDIGTNADFFHIGGDSIRALMLSAKIEQEFSVSITPMDIFTNPTIKSLVPLIMQDKGDNDIYVYHYDENLPEMIFVHTGHAGGEAYSNLSKTMKGLCSFVCVEPYNIFHPEMMIKGIDNLAAKYIEIVKKKNPHGPYILGGWSYGGLIAYEMACQLAEQGEEIQHLFIMDSNIMNDEEKHLFKQFFTADEFDEYLEKDPLFERFRRMGVLDRVKINSKNVLNDMLSFVPKKYDGPVTFFKAMEYKIGEDALQASIQRRAEEISRKKPANGFEKVASNLKIVNIDSDHDSFMRNYALYKISLTIEMTINKITRDSKNEE